MKTNFCLTLKKCSLALLLCVGALSCTPERNEQGILTEHPRLLFTRAEEPAVKRLIKEDPLAGELADTLRSQADSIAQLPQIPYKFDKYGNMLWTSRAYVARLGTLALAYRLYGDEKYLRAANEALLWVCNFPDWDPKHYLDTAEMTTAVAIAYDWLFDALPEATKELVKNCIYKNAVSKVLREYAYGGPGSWAKRETNWNVVCNTGMTLGALAVAEDYPQETDSILKNAAKYMPNCLKHFAPDGVCYEGPGYWGYTNSYLALYLKAVTDNGGDKGNIAKLPGVSKTALFYKRTLTPAGRIFNFANSGEGKENSPAFFLFSKLYNQPEIAEWYREELKQTLCKRIPQNQNFYLALPWFNTATATASDSLPRMEVYHNDINDLVVFNGDRKKKGSVFLIAKGGEPSQAHQQLDCGTFLLEADSVCWTEELGADDYALPGFWDYAPNGKRWEYFRNNNFSHNTLHIDRHLQHASGEAFVCEEHPDASQPSATLNMTSLYQDKAESVFRTFTLIDDCTMEVTDKVELLNANSTAYFNIVTKAQVETNGNKAVLTRNGKQFYMEITAPAGAVFKTFPAPKLSEKEYPLEGVQIIEAACRFGKTEGEITVRMSSMPK